MTAAGLSAWHDVRLVKWRPAGVRRDRARLDVVARLPHGDGYLAVSALFVPATKVTAVDDLLAGRGLDATVGAATGPAAESTGVWVPGTGEPAA